MIAIDTSAIVAILENEKEVNVFLEVLENDTEPIISAATFVELQAVMKHKRGAEAMGIVLKFMELAEISIMPFTKDQAHLASEAYARYSVLNLGDSFSYALAKSKDIPLLYKGDDFSKTDLKSWS